MDELLPRRYKDWQVPVLPQLAEHERQFTLKEEEQILHAVSARAPIAETLNNICAALDCQIGNTVSLVSVPGPEAPSAAEGTRAATLLGLYVFYSAKLLGDLGEELGSLEVYCCGPRVASAEELRLLDRAQRVAAVAIDREIKAALRAGLRISENRPVQRRVLEWPVSADQS